MCFCYHLHVTVFYKSLDKGRYTCSSILLRLSHFRSLEHCQHKPLTSTSWTDHRPFPPVITLEVGSHARRPFYTSKSDTAHYTLRTKRLYCLTVHEYSCFCLPRKLMLAFTKWWGLDEMDIMNKSELIYDNSCFLCFVW